jgi:glucokinase
MSLSLGIDIGGTNVKAMLLHSSGRRLARRRWKTEVFGEGREIPGKLAEGILDFLSKQKLTPGNLVGVGVASAGLIVDGVVKTSPNLPHWEGLKLAEELSLHLNKRVLLENDVNALAFAEWKLGAGRGASSMICLALGTGVGGGLILDKRLYKGSQGLGAELGHMSIDLNGRPCLCGSLGCLEAYAGARAIQTEAERAIAQGEEGGASLARFLGKNPPDPKQLCAAAKAGKGMAIRIFEEAGRSLGVAVANLVNGLNPDLFVLAGGVSRAGKWIMEPALAEARSRIMNPRQQKLKIRLRALGDDGASLGAALLVREPRA